MSYMEIQSDEDCINFHPIGDDVGRVGKATRGECIHLWRSKGANGWMQSASIREVHAKHKPT